ncbi:SGNH/GDSL hydrolase family protein [Bacillus luteolus]|uniref:SGNH/GDSL hydrolase family protein n=1 Tax=Litchfieldia luteola TaxID=682179 RepID=A0ABR9QFC7_9BACI|nr:SGNH/GDSL hydrolase family protein [Cytobacillus luteolus]MBE4907168.1 SGNH/GDSL hydrolase family protein [Cytobacillus luteolus]MBP1943361.1 hypothetical protein [Cytobacillus luteolus]
MKSFIVIIITFLSFGSLVFGKIHYDNKIAAHANTTIENKVKVETTEVKNNEVEVSPEEIVDYSALTKNLPEEIVSKINASVGSNMPVNLVILGSKSRSSDSYGWPTLLKQKIEETYRGTFNITIEEISDKTSMEVVNDDLHQPVVDSKPDILLFEPFILTDNGIVRMEDLLENLTFMLEAFKSENPNMLILLQPAHPLYNAKFYPREVNEFKNYAEENEITYLDHWTAWPEQTSRDLLGYLTEDSAEPNEEGHRLWAEFLVDYFVSGN